MTTASVEAHPLPATTLCDAAATASAGQHFLAHEDGFPPNAALEKGYQRRGTLLVYLNDVPHGGATRFEHLGPLRVAPVRGRAVLFFPAFSGGRPDGRCVHLAVIAQGSIWLHNCTPPPLLLQQHLILAPLSGTSTLLPNHLELLRMLRTLHTAEDAEEGAEKWIFQLWLCSGLPRRPGGDAAAAAAAQLAAARRGGAGKQQPQGRKKKR
jgi:2OG-Fe(II) oxygenase superfamily